MKRFLKENLKPLLIGFSSALLLIFVINHIFDLLIKIALIQAK